jgi:hypothetical protein
MYAFGLHPGTNGSAVLYIKRDIINRDSCSVLLHAYLYFPPANRQMRPTETVWLGPANQSVRFGG